MPDVVPAADIDEHRGRDERVAQHGGEERRPEDDVVLFAVHHVSERRRGEAARCERHAGGHVNGDPQAPRVLVVEIRHRADAEEEPPGEEHESVQCERVRTMTPGVKNLAFMGVGVSVHGHETIS